MKKPDEIKQGLRLCAGYTCDYKNCPYVGSKVGCVQAVKLDALEYIRKLEEGTTEKAAPEEATETGSLYGVWEEML